MPVSTGGHPDIMLTTVSTIGFVCSPRPYTRLASTVLLFQYRTVFIGSPVVLLYGAPPPRPRSSLPVATLLPMHVAAQFKVE